MGEQSLAFPRVCVGNVHVFEDDLFDIEVDAGRPGIWGCGAGIGGYLCGFDDIELAIWFFNEVEMAVLQGDDLNIVFLPEDVGEAEAGVEAFSFINGFGSVGLIGEKFYVFQADRDIGEVLKYGNLAAADFEATRELFVEVIYSEVDDSFLLGK